MCFISAGSPLSVLVDRDETFREMWAFSTTMKIFNAVTQNICNISGVEFYLYAKIFPLTKAHFMKLEDLLTRD